MQVVVICTGLTSNHRVVHPMAEVEGRIAKNPPAGGPDDLTLDELLEQMLPLCNDDPFDVADWLNECLRRGKIRLLADGIPVLPHRWATELVIVAKIAGDGRATLEVVSRLDDATARIGNTIDSMGNRLIGALARKATVKAWTIEGESFHKNLETYREQQVQNPRDAGTTRRGRKPYDWELYQAKFYLMLYDDDVPGYVDINVQVYADRLMFWGRNNFGKKGTPEQASMRKYVAKWKPLWKRLRDA